MKIPLIIIGVLAIAVIVLVRIPSKNDGFNPTYTDAVRQSVVVDEDDHTPSGSGTDNESTPQSLSETTNSMTTESKTPLLMSSRSVVTSKEINLPLEGSAPESNVNHTIPIDEIRRGCFRQDCIPSVDSPEFISVSEADDILPDDTIGIALSHKGVNRFYPFNMLVTREIVNDTLAGDPLLVTYCPLCGTGVVFERRVGDVVYEFGVSGMLWQSNLLMYNRATQIRDRNLWSQVLGEAVVGQDAGLKLAIIPSNVVRYTDWRALYPHAEVLNTGRIGDPYNGDYYGVARNFAPNFDESNSPLDPSEYVFGIEIDGVFKAYPRGLLPLAPVNDSIRGVSITISKDQSDGVSITNENGDIVPVVTGFWFSWVAAHPETELWQNNN